MMQLLRRYRDQGVELHVDSRVVRRVRLLNAASICIGMLCVVYMPLFWWLDAKALAVLLVPIALVDFCIPVLNGIGQYRLSRVVFVAHFNLSVFLYAGLLGVGTGIDLLFCYTVMLPLAICGLAERRFLAFAIAVPFLMELTLLLAGQHLFPPAALSESAQFFVRATMVPTTFGMICVTVIFFGVLNERAEKALERSHRDMRLVLDNLSEGLFTMDRFGVLRSERSRATGVLLECDEQDGSLSEVLRRHDPVTANWLDFGLMQLREGLLPTEVALGQLPDRLQTSDRDLSLRYTAVGSGKGLLVSVRDETAVREQELSDGRREDLLAAFDHVVRSPRDFCDFLETTDAILARLERGAGTAGDERRGLHTLKGNLGVMGLSSCAKACDALEEDLLERGGRVDAARAAAVRAEWMAVRTPVSGVLRQSDDSVVLSRAEYVGFCAAVARGTDHSVLAREVSEWQLPPIRERLEREAEYARQLAMRMGLEVDVECVGLDVRVDADRYKPIWSCLSHLTRNAIDHGIESADARVSAGKPRTGRVTIEAKRTEEQVVVSVSDDGAGLDWVALRRSAQKKGLPADTEEDLIKALLEDGVSTREVASIISGRGVGMAAVSAAVSRLGGTLSVLSQEGRGTTVSACFDEGVVSGLGRQRSADNTAPEPV